MCAVAHRHRDHRTRLVVALSARVLDAVVFDPPHRVPRAMYLHRHYIYRNLYYLSLFETPVSGFCQANVNDLSVEIDHLWVTI